jgi:hypothetical protein
MSSSPWTQYNDLTQDITTSWQRYDLGFTAGGTDANTTLELSLGQYTSSVWLDGIELMEGQINPSTSTRISTTNTIPSITYRLRDVTTP